MKTIGTTPRGNIDSHASMSEVHFHAVSGNITYVPQPLLLTFCILEKTDSPLHFRKQIRSRGVDNYFKVVKGTKNWKTDFADVYSEIGKPRGVDNISKAGKGTRQ